MDGACGSVFFEVDMMRHAFMLILLSLLLGGCSLFVTPPTVQVRDVTVTGLDTSGLEMDIFLTVNNPNSYGIRLLGYSYKLQMIDLPLLKGGDRIRRDFQPNQDTDVRLPVRMSYHDLLDILRRFPDPDRVPYQLEAGLEVETSLGTMTIPLSKQDSFAIPPQYRPSNLLRKLGNFLSIQ
jgi:LEA14-like dessication related protein